LFLEGNEMKGLQSPAKSRAVRYFVASVSPLALVAMAGAAHAQAVDGKTAAAAGDDQAIIVTGIRGSLTKAREIKRRSEVVQDSLSACSAPTTTATRPACREKVAVCSCVACRGSAPNSTGAMCFRPTVAAA